MAVGRQLSWINGLKIRLAVETVCTSNVKTEANVVSDYYLLFVSWLFFSCRMVRFKFWKISSFWVKHRLFHKANRMLDRLPGNDRLVEATMSQSQVRPKGFHSTVPVSLNGALEIEREWAEAH